MPAKHALNSKQSAKGYKKLIQEILGRSGYSKRPSSFVSWPMHVSLCIQVQLL